MGDSCILRDTEITTNAKGANAIFVTNFAASLFSGETKKGTITTYGDYSRGFISTFGGLLCGSDITITTNGEFSSAIEVNEQGHAGYCFGCTLTTNGKNSPLLRTKGNNENGWGLALTMQKTTGLAMKSKIANIEGATSVSITEESIMKCGANPTKDNNNFDQGGIMLYQNGSKLIRYNSFSCEDSTLEI